MSLVCMHVSLSKDFTIWHTDLIAYTRCRILNEVIWSFKKFSFIQAIQFVLSAESKWQRSFMNWNRYLVIWREKTTSQYPPFYPLFPLSPASEWFWRICLHDSSSPLSLCELYCHVSCVTCLSDSHSVAGLEGWINPFEKILD